MALTEGIVDTSVFIAEDLSRRVVVAGLPHSIMVSVITVAELRAGVLVADDPETANRRLASLDLARSFQVIPIDEPMADAWALLRNRLRERDQRMPVNDSWIAATAISLGVPVVTQDADYVSGIPGLEVIHV